MARRLGGARGARGRDALLRGLPRRGRGGLACHAASGAKTASSSRGSSRERRSWPTSRSSSSSAATARRSAAPVSSPGSPGSRRTSRRLQLPGRGAGKRARGGAPPRRARARHARASRCERRGALVARVLSRSAAIVRRSCSRSSASDFLIARNTIVAVVPAACSSVPATRRGGRARCRRPAVRPLGGDRARTGARRALRPHRLARRGRAARAARRHAGDRRHAVHEPDALAALSARSERAFAGGAIVQEIAALGLATEGGYSVGPDRTAGVTTPRAVDGFRVVAVERSRPYTLVLYRAIRPTFVPSSTLTSTRAHRRAARGAAPGRVSPGAAASITE